MKSKVLIIFKYPHQWNSFVTDKFSNYYDTELVDDAHLQIVKCHALAGEIEKAVDYLANNRKQFSNDDQLAEAEKFIKQNDKN